MEILFEIEYKTAWGESLSLVLCDKKYPMEWGEGGIWSVRVKDCTKEALKDYTYVVMRDGLIVRSEWEHHSSAPSHVIKDSWTDCPVEGCRFTRKHQADHFDIPGWRGAGVAIPVFSLRTGDDFGIGEFRDLHFLVDWAASTGMSVIQLLPVNDTTRKGGWEDSYPYSPVSSFALHPLYINLQELGIKPDPAFKKVQDELNKSPELDYPRVFKAKMGYIRRAFMERGEKDFKTAAYRKFIRGNAYWLDEYADFCARRDSLEPDYYRWMQYHLENQFAREADYARSRGVSLKGDLPIGVSADSADAYWHPELFNLDSSAGAPPDYFSADGQNWGFPTYNWEAMSRDGYAWWKSRLRKMSRFFDAFRIDHILGFFRIWEIPKEYSSGMMGHFNPALPYSREEIEAKGLPLEGLFHEDPRHKGMYQPLITPASENLPQWQKEVFGALYEDFFYRRHNEFWRRKAEEKLPELLGATGMLACGEDLGMVPDCVPGVMECERILSLKMRGMEHEGSWKELSVCATSSHDSATLRMQYEKDPDPEEVGRVLLQFLASPSMLAIFPLQDWLALDGQLRRKNPEEERINEPANPRHHWRYRLHINIEALLDSKALNARINALLREGRRL